MPQGRDINIDFKIKGFRNCVNTDEDSICLQKTCLRQMIRYGIKME